MTGHGGAGALGLGHTGGDGCVKLQLAVDGQVRAHASGQMGGLPHLVHVLPKAGAVGGIAEESNFRINAEDLAALGAVDAGLCDLLHRGLDVDGAVAEGQYLVFTRGRGADQNEAGGDTGIARLGLDDLEGGPDGVGGGVCSAAQQRIGNAHLHQHGAEVVGLLQEGEGLFLGHTLAFPQLAEELHHLVKALIVVRVDDLGAPDVVARLLCGGPDHIGLADEDGGQKGAGQQPGGRLQNTGVCALGKNDGLGVFLQLLDHGAKTECHSMSSSIFHGRLSGTAAFFCLTI